MKTVKYSIEVNEQAGVYHIPGVLSQGGAATLCGWVDMPHSEQDIADNPINCATCLKILREVKALKLPKEPTK